MKIFQGIDIVRISRMEEAVARRGKRFLDRVFSIREQAYCDGKRMKFEHYAARFAAKEAFLKALKLKLKKGAALTGIEVRHEPTGKPYLELSPAIRKAAGIAKEDRIELSLAHEREYAVATVVAVRS